MLDIKIVQKGQKSAITKLSALSKDINKPRVLFARWGVQALRWIDENFKNEGKYIKEGPWKALSPATIRRRRKGRGKGQARILQDTGRLKASYVYRMLGGNRGIAVGTNVKYAAAHEYGSPKRNLAKRRTLPRNQDEIFMNRIRKTTNNYIKEVIRKRGGGK